MFIGVDWNSMPVPQLIPGPANLCVYKTNLPGNVPEPKAQSGCLTLCESHNFQCPEVQDLPARVNDAHPHQFTHTRVVDLENGWQSGQTNVLLHISPANLRVLIFFFFNEKKKKNFVNPEFYLALTTRGQLGNGDIISS